MESKSHSSAPITSAANSQVRWYRHLNERRGREAACAFLVEGPRPIEQALKSGARPLRVAHSQDLYAPDSKTATVMALLPDDTRIDHFGDRALNSISDTGASQGIIGAFPMLTWNPDAYHRPTNPVLILDRISDPGNLGTLLRSAAAAGCGGVLLSPGCVDPYNPKVVRATAGGIFSVPFASLEWPEIARVVSNIPRRYAATARADTDYFEAELASPCAILIGNEAAGLGFEAQTLATDMLRIPIEGSVESLNAGVAGSLLLFEARRQRHDQTHGATLGPGKHHIPA